MYHAGNKFGLVYNNNIHIRSYFIWATATEEYCRESVLDLLSIKRYKPSAAFRITFIKHFLLLCIMCIEK